MTKLFEVEYEFKGTRRYFVEADTQEEANKEAEERYAHDLPPNIEETEVVHVRTSELMPPPPEEPSED